MKDYSNYKINKDIFFSGAEKKYEIEIDGFRYIMKFQKNSEMGLTYSHVSEFLGSHVFEIVGIPVQETYLGTYEGKNVVIMKNFCGKDEKLIHFNDVGESTLEQDKELYQYSYEDIQQMLMDNSKLERKEDTIKRFWDIFIVDALNGNFDRHGGNWGFIKKNDKYILAPVYDNGSSMFPRLNSDELLLNVMNSKEEMNKRIYTFPTSHIKIDGKKSSYYDVIKSKKFPECNEALIRIRKKIDLSKITELVDSIEDISEVRRKFYKEMYKERLEKILF